jgi:hypothetical protein
MAIVLGTMTKRIKGKPRSSLIAGTVRMKIPTLHLILV